MIKEKCYNIHQNLISVREKLDEGLSRFPDCKKLNKFREKFEENTIGIDNDDTNGIDKESDSPDCQMESNSSASDDDNQKSDFQVLFHKESGNSNLQKQQIGNEDDRVVDDSVTTIPDSVTEGKEVKFIENDNVLVDVVHNEMIKCSFKDSVERSEHSLEKEKTKNSNKELRSQSLKGNTSHATGLYSATEGDEATTHEDVHHILNEDDKVDDSCPATGVCFVIKGDEVKLTEVEDAKKE
nr:hypothetical protein [Tanacetum cinerariifolium]